MFRILTLLLLGLAAGPALCAAESPAMQAARLLPDERLPLDGSLSHPAWQRVPMHRQFVEKDPVNGAAPPQETRVQVLFDERYLYVGVTALDSDPARIRRPLVRADQVNRTQDFVVVYIDAIGTRSAAQFFRVNAAGSTADGIHTASDDNEDFSPDFDWDAAVAHTPQGWTAVLRLPFASLRFAAGAVQDWRIMVARRLPREQFHLMASVPIPRDAPSFIHTMQPLVGVQLPQDHGFLTIRPSITLRTQKADAVDAGRRQNKVDTSLDIKWRPRAEAVIDATLNPDFSQVALDVPQLAGNSRFALFFPEKRPFFFESADLLRSPTDAFYTRSHTQPRAGLRGTWRAADWAGTAYAVDDKGGGKVLIPGAYGTDDLVDQPANRSAALRARSDQPGLQWGGLLATRRYAGNVGDNSVLGPDASWQVSDAWRVRGQWLHSRTSAFTQGRNVDGNRVYVKASRNVGDSESSIGIDDIGSGFRHDGGFVNQVGVRQISLYHNKGWQQVGPLNQFYINAEAQQVRDKTTGLVVKEFFRPGIWLAAANNLEWWLELFAHSKLRSAANAPLLSEEFVASGLVMTPARWFPLLDTNISLGRLADTQANVVRPGLRFSLTAKMRPLARLELEPSLSLAWLKRDSIKTYQESAAQLLAVWHFDAQHTLRAIVQRNALARLAEPGVGAYRSRDQVASLTYTWRQSAGTLLYVGASRARSFEPARRVSDEAFVKLQIDFDEVRAWVGR
jgi:hypothetical protein